MKIAIVTGAGGFIGGALSKELLNSGYKVYGADIKTECLEPLCRFDKFVPVAVDLSTENLSDKISEKADVMFYLSWGGSLGGKDLYDVELQTNNIKIAAKVCRDASIICKKFIFVSSSYEHMKSNDTGDFSVNTYGIAKRAAGDICAQICYKNGMEYVKAVLTNTYGVGDRSKKAVNTIINAMQNNLPLRLVEGNNPNDWVYIDDTVKGLIHVAEQCKAYREYYIGHKNISTFKDKILKMGEAICPERQFTFGEMPENTHIDYTELTEEIPEGFECSSDFKESITKTANCLKSEYPAKFSGGGYNYQVIIIASGNKIHRFIMEHYCPKRQDSSAD